MINISEYVKMNKMVSSINELFKEEKNWTKIESHFNKEWRKDRIKDIKNIISHIIVSDHRNINLVYNKSFIRIEETTFKNCEKIITILK